MTSEVVPVTSETELRELVGEPVERAITKERRFLHAHDRTWLAASPFCLIATAGADGTCDVSPKGDPPGFVKVLDDTTLAIPDRPGNRRVDGFRNILANPQVGLIFLVPGQERTLRINGSAQLVREAPFFDEMVVQGHRPRLALVVHVEQVFFHCAKSFKRARLWHPEQWPDPEALPSAARVVKDVQPVRESLAELEAHYGPQYEQLLYQHQP